MSQHQSQQVPQKFKTKNSNILVRAHRAVTPAQGWRSICSSYGFRSGWSRSEATRRSQSLSSRSRSQASARRLTARRQTVPCSAVSGESIRSEVLISGVWMFTIQNISAISANPRSKRCSVSREQLHPLQPGCSWQQSMQVTDDHVSC